MQCPVCDEKLREIERHGVMVDICPSCKGVWLDRGELEKIAGIEGREDSARGDERVERETDTQKRQSPTKRRSLLSDLLEGLGGE